MSVEPEDSCLLFVKTELINKYYEDFYVHTGNFDYQITNLN